MTDKSKDDVAILSAIITNTKTKIIFGGMEPADCEYLVRVMFSGFIDLQAWKEKSARPTAVGQKQAATRSWSNAEHRAAHESTATSKGRSTSRGRATTRGSAVTTSQTDSYQSAIGYADTSSEALSTGWAKARATQNASSNSTALQLAPPTTFTPQAVLGQSQGVTSGIGTSAMQSEMGSNVLSSSTSFSEVEAEGRAEGIAESESEAETDSESESESIAESIARGTSTGLSRTNGESECFVTDYTLMETQMYSLNEQRERLVGDMANMAPRECLVKVGHENPTRVRTATLTTGFKSDYCRRVMMPVYLQRLARQSPYIFPIADVDAQIAARFEDMRQTQRERDAPPLAPVPITDPTGFASDFWKKRSASKQPPARNSPPSLRVIDGERGGDNDDQTR